MCNILVASEQARQHTSALASIKHHAEALELPSCPFCGGEAQVCLGVINCTAHVLIRCSRCGSSTRAIDAGTHEPQSSRERQQWGQNVRAAITAAAVRWSRRP